jgi:hypothetical protein
MWKSLINPLGEYALPHRCSTLRRLRLPNCMAMSRADCSGLMGVGGNRANGEADRRCQRGSVLLNAGIGYCTSIASFARW